MLRSTDWILVPLTILVVGSGAVAQTTTRVSVDSIGFQGNGRSFTGSLSADGRFVLFGSVAGNLVPGDGNGVYDVFVRDRLSNTTECVSLDPHGAPGNAYSNPGSISNDGRFVAFESTADNLVPGGIGGLDIYVRDRQSGTTERVSVDSGGTPGNGGSFDCSISEDGRFVAFVSWASNLAPGDTNSVMDAFVRDRQLGTTERVSLDSSGSQGTAHSMWPTLSSDGRFVAFMSTSSFVTADMNAAWDIFVRDRQTGLTECASVNPLGIPGISSSFWSAISASGRFVAFQSDANDLVSGDTNGAHDIFVRDRLTAITDRISVNSDELGGNNHSALVYSNPRIISGDGRYVVFQSLATNLAPGDTNGTHDVFLRDRQAGTTERVSLGQAGVEGDGPALEGAISANGRYIAFRSEATNLISGDTNGSEDVFLADRGPFIVTAFCFGDGAALPCPCGNSGQPGRGCDNSLSTGGALLSSTGQAVLAADTLVLTSAYERPTALSLFWQGGSEVAPRPFGDGIGCMGSPLKRLYFRNAVAGIVIAPQGADLSVSARSAVLGNPIAAGTDRVYHVFYRDPDVSFCPSPLGSTFNTTNGLRVTWGP